MLQLTTVLFLISFSMLSALNYLAIKLFLYWRISWFDMPMHFFGGAVVALGVFTLSDLRILPRDQLTSVVVLGLVLATAVAWEIFEVVVGVPVEDPYFIDTAIDLLLGCVGGLVGYKLGKRLQAF